MELLGEAGKVATAFITLAIRSREEIENGLEAERPPLVEGPALLRVERVLMILARLAPQHPDELYSEFDFTDASAPGSDLITVSYAESIPRIPESDAFDFEPSVARAEAFANSYHAGAFRRNQLAVPCDTA